MLKIGFSFVLQDSDIYYLIFLDRCYVNITTFEKKENKFYEVENENIRKLINYTNPQITPYSQI